MSKTITLTDEQYQALQQGGSITIQPPNIVKLPKRVNIDEVYYLVSGRGRVSETAENMTVFDKQSFIFGNYFKTKETAIKVNNQVSKLLKLHQWLEVNDDGWVADWSDSYQGKYFIYFENGHNLYRVGTEYLAQEETVVYMSKPNTEKLAKQLNSGIYKLTKD